MSKELGTRKIGAAELENHLVEACVSKMPGWEANVACWLSGDNKWLYRHCANRLGSIDDADDAVQEITIKVIRALPTFEQRSMLRTWVTRIANNHCSTMLRARAAKSMTAHLQFCIELLESDRAGNSEIENTAQVNVQRTLGALSEKNSEILQLRFFAELSLQEIAGSLDLSLSAAKMRLYRAMDAFKNHYG